MRTDSQFTPNLYLVGFMGAGKSAVGRGVASRMKMKFIDSDAEIERQAGKPIRAIFADEGEAAFRMMEKDFISHGHSAGGCVVSTGGGLVMQPGMIDLLRTKGVVICLFASVDTIIERTSKNKNRPLLNVEDPAAKVKALLAERLPVYRSAGTGVSTENRPLHEVIGHVSRIYRQEARRFGQPRSSGSSSPSR